MISFGIPTYNYNVYPLVREINKQAKKLGILYEILVYDDASTIDFNLSEKFLEFSKVIYKKLDKNSGRIAIRRQIAADAKFDYLLFLDADTFPKDRFFISKILKIIEQKADIYFGGIQVAPHCADTSKILRWKYGKNRENIDVTRRKKKPYISIISGALLINKQVYLQDTNPLKNLNHYGLDSFFTYQLKKNRRKVIHYNNPVIHLGLETNEVFLEKTQKALETYRFLISQYHLTRLNKITVAYSKLSKILPQTLFNLLYKTLTPLIKKNLLGKNPSLLAFDIYKLLYYSQLNKKQHA